MSFYECYQVIRENEGGDVSSSRAERIGDPGGATSRGITAATLKRLRIPRAPADLTELEVREIYRVHYWLPVRRLEIHSKGLALAAFDFAVQSGPTRPIRVLQGLVGVNQDGVAGPATGRGLEAYAVLPAILDLSAARRRLLEGWVRALPRRLALLRGLMARVDRVERLAVQWAVDERPTQPADVLWRGFARVPRDQH